MQWHHNDPIAGHSGKECTIQKCKTVLLSIHEKNRYLFTLKNVQNSLWDHKLKANWFVLLTCPFTDIEILEVNLFASLHQIEIGKKWIIIVEDCEKIGRIFFSHAGAYHCLTTPIEEIFISHSMPRWIISHNGPQIYQCCPTRRLLHFKHKSKLDTSLFSTI